MSVGILGQHWHFAKEFHWKLSAESMGHENETTTRIYLASLGQSVVDKANVEVIKLE